MTEREILRQLSGATDRRRNLLLSGLAIAIGTGLLAIGVLAKQPPTDQPLASNTSTPGRADSFTALPNANRAQQSGMETITPPAEPQTPAEYTTTPGTGPSTQQAKNDSKNNKKSPGFRERFNDLTNRLGL